MISNSSGNKNLYLENMMVANVNRCIQTTLHCLSLIRIKIFIYNQLTATGFKLLKHSELFLL